MEGFPVKARGEQHFNGFHFFFLVRVEKKGKKGVKEIFNFVLFMWSMNVLSTSSGPTSKRHRSAFCGSHSSVRDTSYRMSAVMETVMGVFCLPFQFHSLPFPIVL